MGIKLLNSLVPQAQLISSSTIVDWGEPLIISAESTAIISRHHILNGPNFNLSLPPYGTNIGKYISIQIDSSATGFYTINGSQVMWKGEHVIFVATLNGWEYIHKSLIPMTVTAYKSFPSTYTIPQTTVTKIELSTFSSGTCAPMFSSSNYRFDIKRSGVYNIYLRLSVMSGAGNYFQVRYHKNGSFVANTNSASVNPIGDVIFNQDFSLVVNDYIEMYCYSTISGAQLYGPQADLHFGKITELNI